MTQRIDHDFIRKLEGFKVTGYVPMTADGQEPLGRSGVTIGSGVDLGAWSEAKLLAIGIPASVVARLEPYLGLTGWPAIHALQQAPLVLTAEEAKTLSDTITDLIVDELAGRYDKAAKDLKFDDLPLATRTVIASVAFQYGTNLARRTPEFWKQVTTGDWDGAYENLCRFGDSYVTRRGKEAALLKTAMV